MTLTSPPPRWLHIGAGAFHRAHQAAYLDQLAGAGAEPWRLAVGNIRADQNPLLEQLAAQQGQYTLETVSPAGERLYRRIRAIDAVLPWNRRLSALIDEGAHPATRVISFTVTEAGYYLNQEQALDTANPELADDLHGGLNTLYGAVAAILRVRAARGGGALTLLNCDNLRHNGERFRQGLEQFLTLRQEHELLAWTRRHSSCPNAMVDRITPRPPPELAERVAVATGWRDPCAITAESFTQWVIEDRFAAGRPALERVGAQLVADVQPYEEAKIRILNASHSGIAWAGSLLGLDFIHQGAADPDIRRLAYDYVSQDVIPCLSPSPLDLAGYRDSVLERFGNPALCDSNQRVAADGYAKLPGFIAPTLRESIAAGRRPDACAMLPALFLRFLQRWRAGRLAYAYQDGSMDIAACHRMLAAADPVAAFCADSGLWGPLAGAPALAAPLRAALARVDSWLESRGRG
ncbi:D-arabinitol 4-dehydrogenase [Chromobacterium haemolyticum]|uniref:D-arabinitol 4-dehydrogenase n=1 Tax=Chromobacterium haemolyticum TaxID=394935 RepID=UPI0040573669